MRSGGILKKGEMEAHGNNLELNVDTSSYML